MTSSSRRLNLRGTVDAITYPGADCEPVVSVLLAVGDQKIVLSFLGRVDMHSFSVGSQLHVKGMLSNKRGVATIFNPTYTVLAN